MPTPWAVVYTNLQAERWAASNLSRLGYDVFLPLVTVTRRDRVLPTLTHRVETPLFPRYIFTVINGPWTPVRYAPGVAWVLMDDNHPARVPDAAITAIRTAISEADYTRQPERTWAPGDPVRLTLGALAGHPAVVLSVRRVSARVAVMALGALREALVPLAALSRRD